MRKQFLKCATAFLLTVSLLLSMTPLLVGAEEKDTSQQIEVASENIIDSGITPTPIEPLLPETGMNVMASNSTVNDIDRTPGSGGYRQDWCFKYTSSYTDDYVYLSPTDAVVDGVYVFESISEAFCGILNAFYTDEPVGYGFAMQYGDFYGEMPIQVNYFDPYACFKVTKKPGTNYYIIRWMNNHLYGFSGSGGTLSVKALPYDDSQVALADTFSITYEGNGFVIKPYGYTTAISAPADTSIFGEELEMLSPSSAGDRCKWNLVRYTGLPMYGMSIYEEHNELENEGVTAGETLSVKITAFSTVLQVNEPHVTVDASTASKATVSWNSATQTASIFGRDDDLATLNISIRNALGNVVYTFVRDFYVDLPFYEGVYSFENKRNGTYMQIDPFDASDGYMSAQAAVVLDSYNNGEQQRWNVLHVTDGYYKILCEKSGLALSVPATGTNQTSNLIQENYIGASRQEWKFTKKSDGSYVIRPRSAENASTDWCLSAQLFPGILSTPTRQDAYTDNSLDNDEWLLTNVAFYSLALVGAVDGGYDHTRPRYEAFFTQKGLQGYASGRYTKVAFTKELDTVSFLMFLGHGEETLICIDNANEIEFTTTDLAALPDGALENLQLVVLSACLTAQGGTENPNNFANVLYNKGAKAMIAFKIKTDVPETQEFSMRLAERISEGHKLAEAYALAQKDLKESEYGLGETSPVSILNPSNVYLLGNFNRRLCDP